MISKYLEQGLVIRVFSILRKLDLCNINAYFSYFYLLIFSKGINIKQNFTTNLKKITKGPLCLTSLSIKQINSVLEIPDISIIFNEANPL